MAGLLGEIYSAGNVARRKLTDLLGNPLLSAQQFVGNINDRARALNELTAAAAREGIDYGPASQQLGGLMAEGYNPMGLTVYHGSPAKFSKFDRTKIGSGEGAQAYGYGHYVAESPAVAKGYQEKLSNTGGAKRISSKFGQLDDAITEAQGKVDYYENLIKQGGENVPLDRANSFLKISKKNLQDLQDMKAGVPENKGAFYEIDLPDEQIAQMLDYDKPISKQKNVMLALESIAEKKAKDQARSEIENNIRQSGIVPAPPIGDDWMNTLFGEQNVKSNEIVKNLVDEQMSKIDFAPMIKTQLDQMKPVDMTWNMSGKQFYELLTKQQGSPEKASEAFKAQGIPGIRYLDQDSRGTGVGTQNFVVFPGNEDLLTILKRNSGLLD